MTVSKRVVVRLDFDRVAQARLPGMEPPLAGQTVEVYGTEWIKSRLTSKGSPLRQRTRELYEDLLRLHIAPELGSLDLSEVTPELVRTWTRTLRRPGGPGACTAAKAYRLLHVMFRTAVDEGLVVANPCRVRGAGVEPSTNRVGPSVAQVRQLADAIGPRLRLAVLLAGFVGLRKGEVLGLQRRDIDLDGQTVTVERQRQACRGGVQAGNPKSEAGCRVLPLPAPLVPEVEVHLGEYVAAGDDSPVFAGVRSGRALYPSVLNKQWRAARTKVGLDHVHFHDLRHTAGTEAAATGAPLKDLMYWMGHATVDASMRYQHALDEPVADLAVRLGQRIQGCVVPDESPASAAAAGGRATFRGGLWIVGG